MSFDLLQAGILAFAGLLLKELNSLPAQEHKGKRVVDIGFAEVQPITSSSHHCLMQESTVPSKILDDLWLHAVGNDGYVIDRFDKAMNKGCGTHKDLFIEGWIEITRITPISVVVLQEQHRSHRAFS